MEIVQEHRDPGVIETLPPLDELRPQVPISPATGQPRRSKWMVVAMTLLYASTLFAAASLCKGWWDAIHMHTFAHAVKIIEWWQPRPGGWRSIVAVVLMFALGGLMTAAPAIAGFNAWNGYRWSRWAALFATVVALGAFAMNSWALPALPLAALGAALLWLPAVSRYFRHWDGFRAGSVVIPRRTPDEVVYGALSRFR